ncbi:hypothetical protein KM043_010711 [Ampulex compressa]|nr:hypothetical protein KM043_010711 [Ampulex compressa]
MELHRSYLAGQLRPREEESAELQRLRMKFGQLERAFEVNLRWQRQRELRFERLLLESQARILYSEI